MLHYHQIKVQKVHCIGVGGIGVSALAELLFERGLAVTGSDKNRNQLTAYLEQCGVHVFDETQEQDALTAVEASDLVVYSSAIPVDHPQRVLARKLNKTMVRRGCLLAYLMQDYSSIVIAGTHGKTTTTSLTAFFT